jgi:hypothetical protein
MDNEIRPNSRLSRLWKNLPAVEKQRLFYFIFDKRIAYSRENGYRTAEAMPFSSLFEGFTKQNASSFDETSCMVDLSGIEPLTF